MIQVPNLLIKEYDQIVEKTLEQARQTKSLSPEKFGEFLLSEAGQQTFEKLDDTITDMIVKKLTPAHFNDIQKKQAADLEHTVTAQPFIATKLLRIRRDGVHSL